MWLVKCIVQDYLISIAIVLRKLESCTKQGGAMTSTRLKTGWGHGVGGGGGFGAGGEGYCINIKIDIFQIIIVYTNFYYNVVYLNPPPPMQYCNKKIIFEIWKILGCVCPSLNLPLLSHPYMVYLSDKFRDTFYWLRGWRVWLQSVVVTTSLPPYCQVMSLVTSLVWLSASTSVR